jgi:hypothetical protein
MPPHDKRPDRKRIVAFLAEESHVPIDDVAILYEHERAALVLSARVTNFLDIFAVRNVQEILHKRHKRDTEKRL